MHYKFPRDFLIELSTYLGEQKYREVSNLIALLDQDLKQENEPSDQPLETYVISANMRTSLQKYLYTKPYGEVYKFVYTIETTPCIPASQSSSTTEELSAEA